MNPQKRTAAQTCLKVFFSVFSLFFHAAPCAGEERDITAEFDTFMRRKRVDAFVLLDTLSGRYTRFFAVDEYVPKNDTDRCFEGSDFLIRLASPHIYERHEQAGTFPFPSIRWGFSHSTGKKWHEPRDKFSLAPPFFHGLACHIWEFTEWPGLRGEFAKQDIIQLYHRIAYNKNDPRFSIKLDRRTYETLGRRSRAVPYQRFTDDPNEAYNYDDRNYRAESIAFATAPDGSLKTQGEGYAFEVLLDRKSGVLATYLIYQDTNTPRDVTMEVLLPRISPEMLKAAPWTRWGRGNTDSPLVAPAAVRERELGKIAELKRKHPDFDSTLTMFRDTVFGEWRYVWQLAIWKELGERFKRERTPHVLYFNEEDVPQGREPEVSQHYLVITPALYEEMERLRQDREAKTRRADEIRMLRETGEK